MKTGLFHHMLGDILHCMAFYTRLPLPRLPEMQRSFAAMQWAAPLTGVIPGAIVAGILITCLSLDLPVEAAAALALGAGILSTGALHEDGLADVADGFGGGQSRERKLEIMKDSRIGAYGVLALLMSGLLRWSALTALALLGAVPAAIAIIGAHVASRALMPSFMMLVPPARSNGLSAGIGQVNSTPALIALLIGTLALLPQGVWFTAVAALWLAGWFMFMRRLSMRHIGGQTGDVLGTLQQGSEILLLLAACALL